MADQPLDPDTGDTGVKSDSASPPGVPRWVKVSGIIVIALVLLFVGLRVTGLGGNHGPGRHGPGGAQERNASRIDGAREVAVIADDFAFEPSRIELTAGEPVNVVLSAADGQHDLVVDEVDFHVAADRDEVVGGGLLVNEPGAYVGYCSVAGHREAGMELEVMVAPADGGIHDPSGWNH